ncbi:hypothetical protein GGR52DRAFT_383818 [Hypoxylon sp. FL1284]|nr:hypothetical protein GGR52DRAFT_383818 [Hypoxylon sp. FL1284]
MESRQPPSPAKRKLPFKRTVRRKSSEAADNDGLSLFSRSSTFFEEQQRLAKEKEERAARREEKKKRLAREEQAKKDSLEKPAKKRHRASRFDDEKEDPDSDQDSPINAPAKRYKSPSAPRTPSSQQESPFATSTKRSGERFTRSQSRKAATPVISLEEEDDDDDPVFLASPSKRPVTRKTSELEPLAERPTPSPSAKTGEDVITLDDDSDSQPNAGGESKTEDKEEDPSEYYVRLARERAQKAKEEREARENGTGEAEDDPVIQILVHAQLEGVHPMMFRRKLSQPLTVVYKTWVEQQVAKHCLVPRSTLETMFFTWKGNKVYPHTSLRTLGIQPERDGNLYPSWKRDQDGYHGHDRVLFEAWTQELYEEYQKEKEKQRLRDLGEFVDDGEEQQEGQDAEHQQTPEEDQKIRVQFKAKNVPVKNATVRSSTTAAQLVKVYRRLAGIPENKTIELRWDGEVLEPDVTVEEAEIEDMDSIEVHVK